METPRAKDRFMVAAAILLAVAQACSGNGLQKPAGEVSADGKDQPDAAREMPSGETVPLCTPGERRCGLDATVEICTGDGSGFEVETECRDANPCTEDQCKDAACFFPPLSKCNDNDPCTLDTCLPFTGDCSHSPDPARKACCKADSDCDDAVGITTDLCDLATGACINAPDNPVAQPLSKLGSKGTGKGQLANPKGLAVLQDGTIVVADAGNNRVLFLAPSGEQLAEINTAFDLPLKAPGCAAQAPDGRIFVCDTGNDRVLLLDPGSAASGAVAACWPPPNSGATLFMSPTDVAADAQGNAYVADGPGEEFDTGNRILKLNPKGQVTAMQGKTGQGDGNFDRPSGLAVAGNAQLFITDQGNSRVQVLDHELKFVSKFGTEGGDPGMLKGPSDIAMTPSGLFYVADAGNQRVQLFTSCQPDCTGRVCGDDGCSGSCGDCPTFGECNATGLCDGWVGEAGEGCNVQDAAGCGGCPPENCVCTGEGALDPSLFYEGAPNDPFCCEAQWDQICVFEAQFVCGYSCPLPTEWPPIEPTFAAVMDWKNTSSGTFASPLKIALDSAGLVYVLDAVKSEIHVFKVFLPVL